MPDLPGPRTPCQVEAFRLSITIRRPPPDLIHCILPQITDLSSVREHVHSIAKTRTYFLVLQENRSGRGDRPRARLAYLPHRMAQRLGRSAEPRKPAARRAVIAGRIRQTDMRDRNLVF